MLTNSKKKQIKILKEQRKKLVEQKDWEGAVKIFKQMIEIEPKAKRFLHCGHILIILRRYEEASTHFKKALELSPNLIEAKIGLEKISSLLNGEDETSAGEDSFFIRLGERSFDSSSPDANATNSFRKVLENKDKILLANLDRYKIKKQIGRGGMGRVYKAYDTRLRRFIALKVLLWEKEIESKDIERFWREARANAKLCHPNIVRIHDISVNDGLPFFTMDFIEGVSLDIFLQENSLTTRQAIKLITKVGHAIHYAHSQGVIHRDLKPSNIMIDLNGEPKITDFGLAKVADDSKKLSESGVPIGTLYYMPPEQVNGDLDKIDERSDLYSLGIILYEILSGSTPFGSLTGYNQYNVYNKIVREAPTPLTKIKANIPRSLSDVCLKAIEKETEDRYRNVAEFIDAIEFSIVDYRSSSKSNNNHEKNIEFSVSRFLNSKKRVRVISLLLFFLCCLVTIVYLFQAKVNVPQDNANFSKKNLKKPVATPRSGEPVTTKKPVATPRSNPPATIKKPAATPRSDEPVTTKKPVATPRSDEPVTTKKLVTTPRSGEPVTTKKPVATPIITEEDFERSKKHTSTKFPYLFIRLEKTKLKPGETTTFTVYKFTKNDKIGISPKICKATGGEIKSNKYTAPKEPGVYKIKVIHESLVAEKIIKVEGYIRYRKVGPHKEGEKVNFEEEKISKYKRIYSNIELKLLSYRVLDERHLEISYLFKNISKEKVRKPKLESNIYFYDQDYRRYSYYKAEKITKYGGKTILGNSSLKATIVFRGSIKNLSIIRNLVLKFEWKVRNTHSHGFAFRDIILADSKKDIRNVHTSKKSKDQKFNNQVSEYSRIYSKVAVKLLSYKISGDGYIKIDYLFKNLSGNEKVWGLLLEGGYFFDQNHEKFDYYDAQWITQKPHKETITWNSFLKGSVTFKGQIKNLVVIKNLVLKFRWRVRNSHSHGFSFADINLKDQRSNIRRPSVDDKFHGTVNKKFNNQVSEYSRIYSKVAVKLLSYKISGDGYIKIDYLFKNLSGNEKVWGLLLEGGYFFDQNHEKFDYYNAQWIIQKPHKETITWNSFLKGSVTFKGPGVKITTIKNLVLNFKWRVRNSHSHGFSFNDISLK